MEWKERSRHVKENEGGNNGDTQTGMNLRDYKHYKRMFVP